MRYSGKYAKRVSVTETEESDFPDKRQRDGIGGEASVTVGIPQRTMQPGRSSRQRCRLSEYIMTIVTSLFIKALNKTSDLHENSGTVEYFAGQ